MTECITIKIVSGSETYIARFDGYDTALPDLVEAFQRVLDISGYDVTLTTVGELAQHTTTEEK